MKVAKLTKEAVDRLPKADKPYVAWCGELAGFGVSVRPSGSKSFIAQYDIGGRNGSTRRYTIGQFGNPWTVEKARVEATKVLSAAKIGIDRQAEKAADKVQKAAERTIAELCDEYMDACEKGLIQNSRGEPKKASTIGTDKGRIERHIKRLLGKKKIGEVTRRDVERFLHDIASGKSAADVKTKKHGRAIVTGGKGTATRTVRLLGGIFTYAVKRGYRADNPRSGVQVYADRKGERYLSMSEVARLSDALREAETIGLPWQPKAGKKAKHVPKTAVVTPMSPHAIAAIRLLMLTGCRLSEILKLEWSHVDLERGVLNLPTSKTGAKKVLIGSAAMKVLADLPRMEGNPFVIVGEAKDKPRSGLKRPWERITARAGLSDLRLHDLRHSFASVGVESNLSLSLVGKLLGHASPQTTARYAHVPDSAERRALNEIEGRIAAAAGLIQTAEVLPFKQSAA